MVTRVQLNAWKTLEFYNPAQILNNLEPLQARPIFGSGSWDFEKHTRRAAKLILEKVDAAIAAYLFGKLIGITVDFAPIESADYDCILRFDLGNEYSMNPLQLKEIVPSSVNPVFDYENFIKSLSKYSDSKDLMVAIKVGRELDGNCYSIGELGLGGVFFYGQSNSNPNNLWFLGDCQREPKLYEFTWPSS